MALVRYNPWGVGGLQNEINRLVNLNAGTTAATSGWTPNVDIHEYQDRFQMYLDLPGVGPEDVEITLDQGVLTISGERKSVETADGEELINRRSERANGQFVRRFNLPETVDADNVSATENHGVLEVVIPKQAATQPRRIEVH